MKPSKLILGALPAALILVWSSAWACSSQGPNRHVGTVLEVDQDAKTFTLRDVETRKPITFRVDTAVMENLRKLAPESYVIVEYRKVEDNGLIAISVEQLRL